MHQQLVHDERAIVLSSAAASVTAIVVVAAVGLSFFAPDTVEHVQANLVWYAAAAVVMAAAAAALQRWYRSRRPEPLPRMFSPRPFSFADLAWYDGERNSPSGRANRRAVNEHPLPEFDGLIFLAVKGVVYNVAPEYYGPGAGYHAFAAVDCSRHLGKVVVGTAEANADWTTLSEKHVKILNDWEERFRSKYCIVGWVVPDAGYITRAVQFAP